MNLTLSINKDLLERARKAARAQGKSVNQMVREYLEQLCSGQALDATIDEYIGGSGQGRREKGWAFDRDELHERT
ncbi:ribbon-helix-helix protein, CopG family [Marinihelvus fidelis]|uniref:Ribbon-helix-helix protein, CopG family n=1 Tax=Marinihelvus fidelis TaxID=2613842 RepID=A0A5N0TG27_9GAMM|nr:DUF6364 family protein [Marinihelvus fidelis]KAA9133990.1 ribbon-helix-helix protein, CopG family [Marinihelvus fidelis]